MTDVFISYSRDDQKAAQLVAERLKSAGFSVFFDQTAIVAGESFSDRIQSTLQRAKAVIVLLSTHSRRNGWVQDELQVALEGKKLVVPVLLDDGATQNWLWPLLAQRQSVKLDLGSPELNDQLDRIARSLERIRGEDGPTSARDQMPMAAPRARSSGPWRTVVVALVSAAIGGLITWLLL